MYEYRICQWLLFFYLYCFCGWCFESAYVSLKSMHPVNRGFLTGPLIPIYGTGAVTVLFAALPFKQSPVAVYFVGLFAATLLEYVVGASMEAIFKVRYWDYSNQKFNLNGHICLSSSIAWGFFSIGMVYYLHKPFEEAVLGISYEVVQAIVLVITVLASVDFYASLRTALDIRDMIIQIEKMREEMERMRRRIEIIETFAMADLEEKLEERGSVLLDEIEEAVETRIGKEIHLKEHLHESIDELMQRLDFIRNVVEKHEEAFKEHAKEYAREREEELSRYHVSLSIFKDRLHQQMSIDKRKLLLRNPGAVYLKNPGIIEELREAKKRHG